MEFLASIFVGKPFNILVVSLVFFAAYAALRIAGRDSLRPAALLIGASAWMLYAAWEWLVVVRSPEADIRVDLMLIWPLVALMSLLSIWKALRPRES